MQTFKINDELTAVCEWKKTRNAFKHEATLLRNGQEVASVKICYQNRTWERYEFESVLYKLATHASLSPEEQVLFGERIRGQFAKDDEEATKSRFGSVAMVAMMGEVFGQTAKEKNDWKARMLQAGLPGLDIPEDWETLSEEEKASRLDAVIAQLKA